MKCQVCKEDIVFPTPREEQTRKCFICRLHEVDRMMTVTCINCKEPGDAREMTLGLFCKDCLRRMEEDELNAKEEELYDKLRKAL